ncbi:MAG: YtxH domain-containing protein [Nitrospirota bacterium]
MEKLDEARSSTVLPFLVGGIVGAGLALLFAPKSGRELRDNIMNYMAQVRDTLSSAVEESTRRLEEGKSALASSFEAGKTAFMEEKKRHQSAT